MQVGEAELRETLRAMLEAHCVDCEIDGEWIQLRGNDARMQGYIRTDPSNATYTQLDIYLEPWPGTLIANRSAALRVLMKSAFGMGFVRSLATRCMFG